ncbi:MAG TPA: tetratricopeptide repeat protein [Chloroflexia bacterium]|nr:tetratricopeptide repeat protein [Chloroflexia bacterium]
MSNESHNGNKPTGGQEPELSTTRAAIERGLVFIELKEEVRERLELPALIPIFKEDLENELNKGQLPPSSIAAGIEALKLLRPNVTEYDRFLARYYLLEGQRFLQEEPRDEYQAQRYFQKALDLDVDELSAEGAFYLAALVTADDPDKAVSLYRLSIELNPQAATPHFELGRLLRKRRDLPGALEEFEAAYRLDPGSANLLNEVGDTHLMANDMPKAQAAYRRAAELEPEFWELPVKLGIIDYNLDDFPAAIRDLRNGLDMAPDELEEGFTQTLYVEGLYYLALAYLRSGRPDQARKLFRAVLQIDPGHQGALEGLS